MAVATMDEAITERAEQARVARLARLAALVIDTILFSVISLIVNSVFGVAQVTAGSFSPGGGYSIVTTTTEVPWALLTLVWLVYLAGFEAAFGATPGKLLGRLRVVRVDGRPLGLGSIWTRNLLRLIDWLPLLYVIGGISVLVTANSQRVGDRWAGTTVVYRHHALRPGETRGSAPVTKTSFTVALVAIILFVGFFDYFGRPQLVIQGLENTNGFPVPGVTSYQLGTPSWGLGTVTYPATLSTGTGQRCTGTITLTWQFFGWDVSGSSFDCPR